MLIAKCCSLEKRGSLSSPFTEAKEAIFTYVEGCGGCGVVRREKENIVRNRSETEREQQAPAFEERWAVVDGCRMRYLQSGSGPALLMVHGLLGYSFSWRFALPALVGVGFSDRPPGLDCRLRAHAERLLRFLDGVGVNSCDLLGTSHGGAVAMMAAALAPERIRSLILVAPVNPWSRHGRQDISCWWCWWF